MTKLFTVFFVNACKYWELFVSLSFASLEKTQINIWIFTRLFVSLQKFLVIIVQPTAF